VLRLLGILVAASAGWAGTTSAASADAEPYVAEYHASRAALSSGDREAAKTHALRAWRSAEDQLGDHRLTAILAYNYGRLVLLDEPKRSDEALTRAAALQAGGIADLDASELRFYAAYADLKASEFPGDRADPLRKLLESREPATGTERVEHVAIWLDLSAAYLAGRRFEGAMESAARAEVLVLALADGNQHSLAKARLLGAIARLARTPRTVERIQRAHKALVSARQQFPPQEDIEHFDPLLAEVLAWSVVADIALGRAGEDGYPDHENAEIPHLLPALLASGGDPSGCGVPDLRRSAIFKSKLWSLYRNDRRDDYIGAMVVGLQVGEDRTITGVRVLAEAPGAAFSDFVVERLQGVRLPADRGPHCTGDLVQLLPLNVDFGVHVVH
jgi:hypothetical protein